jgi:hydroxymethylpyrimidine pyrophosphatase-like HAD family hydrolase
VSAPSGYRLLVTDLDGTLLDASGRVHERDRAAIAELQRRGVHVSICTGRMYSGTRRIAHAVGVDGPVGCIDGSHIVRARDDGHLSSRPLDAAALARVLDALLTFRPTSFVFSEDSIFHDASGVPFLPYVNTWSERCEALGDALSHFRAREDALVTGVVSLGTEEQVLGAAAELRSSAGSVQVATFSIRRQDLDGLWGMVIRAAGVNKGTALTYIAEHYGLTPSEVVAVGDWLNDIPMLRVAGRSFAMAQSPDEVKAVATDQLEADAFTGGGIAEAAERAGLL